MFHACMNWVLVKKGQKIKVTARSFSTFCRDRVSGIQQNGNVITASDFILEHRAWLYTTAPMVRKEDCRDGTGRNNHPQKCLESFSNRSGSQRRWKGWIVTLFLTQLSPPGGSTLCPKDLVKERLELPTASLGKRGRERAETFHRSVNRWNTEREGEADITAFTQAAAVDPVDVQGAWKRTLCPVPLDVDDFHETSLTRWAKVSEWDVVSFFLVLYKHMAGGTAL